MSNILKFPVRDDTVVRFQFGFSEIKGESHPFSLGMIANPDTDEAKGLSAKLNLEQWDSVIEELVALRVKYIQENIDEKY